MSAIASMTGFARIEGAVDGLAWAWELRSVNGRTLDVRFRLPNGWDGHEAAFRDSVIKALKRGNVTANLTIKRDTRARLEIDQPVLDQLLTIAIELSRRIPDSPPPSAAALLSLPGVLRQGVAEPETGASVELAGIQAGLAQALQALLQARHGEGERLSHVLTAMLREIARLCDEAAGQAALQPAAHRDRLLDSLRSLLDENPGLPEERIAQEVALLASRSDVREELDRLASHVQAAHELLREAVAIGRKLDFLSQEFNREVNTLCSKSSSAALTTIGLKLKAAVEQFREQVQNIE